MLSEKEMEFVTRVSAETAVKMALEHLEKEREKNTKSRKARQLRNTKMLLKHYRSFKLHARDLESDLDYLEEEPEDIIDQLNRDELAVAAIKKSKRRTLAMISFIDKMLVVYQTICEQSGREEDKRKMDTLNSLYIDPVKQTHENVAIRQGIDTRTVYRDVNNACETLSTLIFGVDSLNMSS